MGGRGRLCPERGRGGGIACGMTWNGPKGKEQHGIGRSGREGTHLRRFSGIAECALAGLGVNVWLGRQAKEKSARACLKTGRDRASSQGCEGLFETI